MHFAAAAGLAPHAAHRQDAARLAADHARQRQLAQVERTGQVHVQHVLPFFRGDVGEQLLLCDAGIAHQHIHPTQRLFRRTERQLAAGPAGHIALHRRDARQLRFQRGRRLGIAVVQHRHAVARRIKGPGRRSTDAPVAAGDQHRAPVCGHRRALGLRLFCRFRFRNRGRLCRFCRSCSAGFQNPGGFVRNDLCRCGFRHRGRSSRRFFRFIHRLFLRCVKGQFKLVFVQEYCPPVVFSAACHLHPAGRIRGPSPGRAALCLISPVKSGPAACPPGYSDGFRQDTIE